MAPFCIRQLCRHVSVLRTIRFRMRGQTTIKRRDTSFCSKLSWRLVPVPYGKVFSCFMVRLSLCTAYFRPVQVRKFEQKEHMDEHGVPLISTVLAGHVVSDVAAQHAFDVDHLTSLCGYSPVLAPMQA
eukprot:4120037-Amphidinium_carterae.1